MVPQSRPLEAFGHDMKGSMGSKLAYCAADYNICMRRFCMFACDTGMNKEKKSSFVRKD